MKALTQKPFIVVILLMASLQGVTQQAILSGKVVNAARPLSFVTVGLKGTTYQTITDGEGRFIFYNIPAGTYTLQASFVGYDDSREKIVLKAGAVTDILVELNGAAVILNDVVVTGVSRATLIRENPLSVSSISPRSISQTAGNNIMDVLAKNAPGFSTLNTGPNISKPFIRGLGYNRVLTLYDGLRQEGQQWGDEHSIEVDAYNVHRAEVIKGPASLMFGSDALAGVVSLFPYVPGKFSRGFEGKVTSEYQSNNGLIGNGFYTAYQGQHWLFMLRGSYRLAKNYSNAVDERVYNTGFKEKNLSALIGYHYNKGYSQLNFTLYDDLQGIPDGSRDSISRRFTRQVAEGQDDDIKDRPLVSDAALNSYTLSPLHQHIQHYRIYSTNSYETGVGKIDLLTGWQQNIRKEFTHPTVPEQAGLFVRLNTINYGLRYSFSAVENFDISAGVNGMLQQNRSKEATDFPIPDYNLFDAGLYLHARWKKDRWTVSGGLRYDKRLIHFDDFYKRKNPATGFDGQAIYPDTANAVLQFPAYRKTFNGLSASFGLTYKIADHLNLKANIGRGYRAPNITDIASNGLDPGAHIIYLGNRNFKTEFSLQEDIELIADFKDLSASVSIFNNDIQNYIYLSLLADANGNPVTDAQGNRTYQYLQAAAQLYGIETWLSFHPNQWKGFAFDNSLAVVNGFNRDEQYKGQSLNGEYLPLIPPMKWLSSISQKFSFKSNWLSAVTTKVEMDLNAAQHRYLGLNNAESFTDGYTVFNTSVIADINYRAKNTMQVQLHFNNILNTVYQSHLNRLKYFEYYSSSPNGRPGMYNMGRNICLKLVVPF